MRITDYKNQIEKLKSIKKQIKEENEHLKKVLKEREMKIIELQKCENVDNEAPPEVPGAGPFAYAPLKPLFNGRGRIDLTYPDPFRVVRSKNKT